MRLEFQLLVFIILVCYILALVIITNKIEKSNLKNNHVNTKRCEEAINHQKLLEKRQCESLNH